jgi:death on curing protein
LTEYLDLADCLLIEEAVLALPAEEIARWPGIGLADSALHAPAAGFGGVELYPDVIDKAAVLCAHLARNHPLPDGNKRVAYLALLEFLARNEIEWAPALVTRPSTRARWPSSVLRQPLAGVPMLLTHSATHRKTRGPPARTRPSVASTRGSWC